LQGPWFNPHAPPAINYGAIGSVIGHEITHGFDDQGRKYDGHGNLADWWTKDDSAQFNQRASCITDQYSEYTIANGTHVQGALVTGEAIADLGGIAVSYRAFHSLAQASAGQADRSGRYTPDQLFFLAFAHLWGSNVRPEYASLLTKVDPHPPMRDRVNGTLANFPPFQEAFDVPDHSPMVNSHRCAIW
jgi:putative endopeptidase